MSILNSLLLQSSYSVSQYQSNIMRTKWEMNIRLESLQELWVKHSADHEVWYWTSYMYTLIYLYWKFEILLFNTLVHNFCKLLRRVIPLQFFTLIVLPLYWNDETFWSHRWKVAHFERCIKTFTSNGANTFTPQIEHSFNNRIRPGE